MAAGAFTTGAAFLAGAAGFLVGVLAAAFLAGAFLAAVFLAGAFLAGAAGFLVGFLAAVFLAAVFLAGAFLAGARTAGFLARRHPLGRRFPGRRRRLLRRGHQALAARIRSAPCAVRNMWSPPTCLTKVGDHSVAGPVRQHSACFSASRRRWPRATVASR